jgi:hypothetical protein
VGTARIQCRWCPKVVTARINPNGHDDIRGVLALRVGHLTPAMHRLYADQAFGAPHPRGFSTDYEYDPTTDPTLEPEPQVWEETGMRWGGDPCPWCGEELDYDETEAGPWLVHPDGVCGWLPNDYPATNVTPRPGRSATPQ